MILLIQQLSRNLCVGIQSTESTGCGIIEVIPLVANLVPSAVHSSEGTVMNIVQIVLIAVLLEPSGYQIAVSIEIVPIFLILPLKVIPAALSIGIIAEWVPPAYRIQDPTAVGQFVCSSYTSAAAAGTTSATAGTATAAAASSGKIQSNSIGLTELNFSRLHSLLQLISRRDIQVYILRSKGIGLALLTSYSNILRSNFLVIKDIGNMQGGISHLLRIQLLNLKNNIVGFTVRYFDAVECLCQYISFRNFQLMNSEDIASTCQTRSNCITMSNYYIAILVGNIEICCKNLRFLNNLYYNILGCAKLYCNVLKGRCQSIASRYSQIFCTKGICLASFTRSSNCLFTNFCITKFIGYVQNSCLFIYIRISTADFTNSCVNITITNVQITNEN